MVGILLSMNVFAQIFAQTLSGGEELGFLDFINLGVLAVLVVAFMKLWIVPKGVLDKAEENLQKREEELQELRTRLDQEVLPQLWRTTDLLAQFANIERDARDSRE